MRRVYISHGPMYTRRVHPRLLAAGFTLDKSKSDPLVAHYTHPDGHVAESRHLGLIRIGVMISAPKKFHEFYLSVQVKDPASR